MDKRKIKIDELKKDNVFKVPDGYFEELPSIIQARVTNPRPDTVSWYGQPAMRWSLVAASLLLFTIYITVFRTGEEAINAESLIAEVNTEDLIAYLEYSDLTTEELIAGVGIENIYIEDIETEDQLLEDIEIIELESLDLLEEIDVSQELL